jgi:glutamyl-tRNA reductase
VLGVDTLYRRRQEDAAYRAAGEAAVDSGVADYSAWLAGRRSLAALHALRERAEERRRARLARAPARLSEDQRRLLDRFSQQLVADLLHEPLRALREDVDGRSADAARQLFGLTTR